MKNSYDLTTERCGILFARSHCSIDFKINSNTENLITRKYYSIHI